jgi:hypothetical protein
LQPQQLDYNPKKLLRNAIYEDGCAENDVLKEKNISKISSRDFSVQFTWVVFKDVDAETCGKWRREQEKS